MAGMANWFLRCSRECYFGAFPHCFVTSEINTKITISWAQKQFVKTEHRPITLYRIVELTLQYHDMCETNSLLNVRTHLKTESKHMYIMLWNQFRKEFSLCILLCILSMDTFSKIRYKLISCLNLGLWWKKTVDNSWKIHHFIDSHCDLHRKSILTPEISMWDFVHNDNVMWALKCIISPTAWPFVQNLSMLTTKIPSKLCIICSLCWWCGTSDHFVT